MPYQAPGARHTCPSADKACVHGQIVSEDGFVGAAFKSKQVDRWTRPGSAPGQAQHIPVGEEFEIELGGILETPAAGNLAAAAIGNHVYIRTTDNVLQLAAQALTTGNLNANTLPVGIVTEVETSRTPDVVRINANMAYLVKVGTGG